VLSQAPGLGWSSDEHPGHVLFPSFALGTNHTADGRSAEQVIQNSEADVPPGGTHRDEAAIAVGPR
jgi:hypothetical protein